MKPLTKLYENAKYKYPDDTEAIRKYILEATYRNRFQNLTNEEKLKLAYSGDVWYEFSQMADRPSKPQDTSLSLINKINNYRNYDIHKYDLFEDSHSWYAFKIALTNSSNALEGHNISLNETKLLIDTFADNISKEIGFTEEDYKNTKSNIEMIKKEDVKATVNHAAAMEHARHNIHKNLNIQIIKD